LIGKALRLLGRDPYANLAAEEAILERPSSGDGLFLLYANDPCCVVGRNQNPWAEISPTFGDPEVGLPILRRVSGGGAVYHDGGNLNWAFIVPRSEHDRVSELGLVILALRGIGIDLCEGVRGGLYVERGPYRGRKVSGTARRISTTRVLHHGTLLVDADLGRLSSSLGGLRLDFSRGLPSAPSPAVNLASLEPGLDRARGLDEVAETLALSITGANATKISADELGLYADSDFAEEAERRLRSWDWTWGATPPFALELEGSEGGTRLDVRRGLLYSASGPGSEALDPLLGQRFEFGTPKLCLAILEQIDVHEIFVPRV
jgi:lipoate-protein ligase A